MRAFSKALRVMPSNYEVWKPIICAIHGHAYGGGAWLALSCDLIIAAEDTRFGAPEAKLSRTVNFAGLITQYLPMAIANEFLLVGDPLPPERAYQLGIFNRVVPPNELMPTATKLAERICENGPVAVRATKETLRKSEGITSYEGKLALAEALYPYVTASEDYKEGAAAFKEKRKPVWKNR
jgi:enoyl-CoA hydratase/carnithine racemase